MEVAEVDMEEAVMVFLHITKYFLMDLLFFKIISFILNEEKPKYVAGPPGPPGPPGYPGPKGI